MHASLDGTAELVRANFGDHQVRHVCSMIAADQLLWASYGTIRDAPRVRGPVKVAPARRSSSTSSLSFAAERPVKQIRTPASAELFSICSPSSMEREGNSRSFVEPVRHWVQVDGAR